MNSIFNMCGTKIYKPTDKMSDLICENYALLQVLSRFGVSLGFGDKHEWSRLYHFSCCRKFSD